MVRRRLAAAALIIATCVAPSMIPGVAGAFTSVTASVTVPDGPPYCCR